MSTLDQELGLGGEDIQGSGTDPPPIITIDDTEDDDDSEDDEAV